MWQKLICWWSGHVDYIVDPDVQVVRGEWHLGIVKCERCKRTKLERIG